MTTKEHTPRPPDGDWLGTPFLTFERRGPFGVATLDRPKARNAMSPAMYYGIGYAVNHVAADNDLAGLIITGSGDVFAPGGDLGGAGGDDWMDFRSLPNGGVVAIRHAADVAEARGVGGQWAGTGWRAADCDV